MRSPWEPIALGLVLWTIGGLAAAFAVVYDRVSAAIVIGSVFGTAGLLPLTVGLVALGVRIGMQAAARD